MESYMEIWTRHYDGIDDRRRVDFLITLKSLKYQGNEAASNAFDVFVERFRTEKPVWMDEKDA